MDPLTIASIIGMGLSAVGSFMGTQASSAASGIHQKIAGLEEDVNQQHRKAMEIDARRRQMDIIRTNQQKQALGMAAATNQGAQFGSGVAGGQAGIAGQSETNLVGVNQSLDIGRSIFGIDSQINEQRKQLASVETSSATASGVSALGSDLFKAAGPLQNLFGGSRSDSAAWSGMNLTGLAIND